MGFANWVLFILSYIFAMTAGTFTAENKQKQSFMAFVFTVFLGAAALWGNLK